MGNPCQPTDSMHPCDAGAMAATAIWSLSFMLSAIIAIIASILIRFNTPFVFKLKIPFLTEIVGKSQLTHSNFG